MSIQNFILGGPSSPVITLIFIYDLVFLLDNLSCKIFADDTLIYKSGPILDNLIVDFQRNIKPIFSWCKFNRLDINQTKTYAMFITNKLIIFPKELVIEGIIVHVITEFKLLEVILYNKLTFTKLVAHILRLLDIVFFSIKRLFYLSSKVKNQFFKTFILPYFEYCLSLIVYFSKASIYKLSKSFYM